MNMKNILMSRNIDKANEFITGLEKYVRTISVVKSSIEGIGVKNVSREMLIKAISGDFDPLNQACIQLITVDLQGVTNPAMRANSQRLFEESVNKVIASTKNMASAVGGYKYGDPYLNQFFEWGGNDIPFIPENARPKIYEMFSTFVRKDRELLFEKHHRASEALNELLKELEKAQMTKGMNISPMLFLFNFFSILETEEGFKVEPKSIDYNHEPEVLEEEPESE